MKALSITGPHSTSYMECPTPTPSREEVLLRVRRVGFCGSDLNTFRGLNPLVNYPRIPGHEIAGYVEATGADVPEQFSPGVLATALPYTACGVCNACQTNRANACRNNQTLGVQRDGAMAQFITLPWQKLILSPHLSELELALIEPLSVGFHAVNRGRVGCKDTVLILGCGMIGLGAIASAGLDRSARVIAVDIDDMKLELAIKCGATHVINSKREPLSEAIDQLTQGHGAQVVIEAAGLPDTFRAAVDLAAFAGRVVYIGYAKEPVSYETKYFVMKELDILGSRNATREDFDRAIRLLESSRYPAQQTVTHQVDFTAAADALANWSSAPSSVTKIHVTF